MRTSILSVLSLPALALAACNVGDDYCQLTAQGWKPAAASYLITDGVSDNAFTAFDAYIATASLTEPTGLSAAVSAAAAAFTSGADNDSPAVYTILNAEFSQMPENVRQPAQSVVSKALAIQNGAAAARPTDMAYMAMAGAAAAAVGVAGIAL